MPTAGHQYLNYLLRALSERDLATLMPFLEPVQMNRLVSLETSNLAIDYLYFPESGIASTVARLNKKREIEVGVTGREGVTGTAVLLGGRMAPTDCYVQLKGHGYRIKAEDMLRLMDESKSLSMVMLNYVNAFLSQIVGTAQANGLVNLQNRLARWLVMIHDRVDGDTFPFTHELLAVMLGARRPGVTVALHVFEGKGWLKATRGTITILNRQTLVDASSGSYGVPEEEYLRLLGASLSKT